VADPLLNSVHLDASRRDSFRKARQDVFAGLGNQTLCKPAAAADEDGPLPHPHGAGDRPCVCLVNLGTRLPLKVGLNTLGRLPDNDLVVPDAHASRRHCTIVMHTSRQCEVHDMASKNGTYLNGAKLTGPTSLKPGDEIRIGEARIVFLTSLSSVLPALSDSGHTHVL
jgi:hypothetical protein